MRQAPRSFARTALASCLFFVGACSGGDPVDQAPVAPVSNTGPRVRWDLGARPLPEVPLPNDVATWADPTSPTGLRVNASMIAPTAFESALREGFNELDGIPNSHGATSQLSAAQIEDLISFMLSQ